MNVGIIGCGLIGQKRMRSLGPDHRLIAVADAIPERASALARQCPGAEAVTDWRQVVARRDVEAVIVSTTNNCLAPISLAGVEAGKHVLVEKPAARRPEELDPLIAASERRGCCVQVGFNHRFHPAFQKAREIFDSGELGPLMFIRARYGHGGRIGYEREWRADPEVGGGGELLDQGVHLIDLARWFLGNFVDVEGFTATYFWQMPVEDNAFLLLRTALGQAAWLHASCTEWKNLFSFELYGRDGKLQIEGLGGSYGVERLTHYKMLPEMGPPPATAWEYPGEDQSWRCEFEAFVRRVHGESVQGATLEDAKAALGIVHRVYQLNLPRSRDSER